MKTSLITAALLAGIAIPGLAFAQSAMPSAAPTTAAPATAATAAAKGVAVGAKVFGPQGEEVGTIETISGGNVVINTGTSRATLAETSFGTGAKGPIIGLTKAQLDAAVMQAKAQASSAMDAALVPGADVSSKDGIAVGKIESVEGDKVVVDRPDEGPVALNRTHFTADAQGLKLVMTAAEFAAAANAAEATATAPSGGDDPAG